MVEDLLKLNLVDQDVWIFYNFALSLNKLGIYGKQELYPEDLIPVLSNYRENNARS